MPSTETAFTYEWVNEEKCTLQRTDSDGDVVFVPTDPGNTDYAEFLSSGATAAPYVAPPEPAPLTTAQKVDNMLAAYGLTRAEMQAALAVKEG